MARRVSDFYEPNPPLKTTLWEVLEMLKAANRRGHTIALAEGPTKDTRRLFTQDKSGVVTGEFVVSFDELNELVRLGELKNE